MFQSRTSLPSLIRGLRAAQQEGNDDEFLSASLQQIKEELVSASSPASQSLSSLLGRAPSASVRSTALLKLAYLQMLGVDLGFATFSVVEAMSVQSFTLKRPAYFACALAFASPLSATSLRARENDACAREEAQDGRQLSGSGAEGRNLADEKQKQQQALSLLTTNLFKKDFNSKETHETSLALSTLAVMSTPEIAAALLPDVLLLLASSRSILRKKAAVCASRFLIQVPALLPSSFPKLRQQLMSEEETPVVTSLCSALLQLIAERPQQYLSLVPPLFHLLCASSSNWLSLKLLKIFALLAPFEPRLPLKLLRPLRTLLEQSRAKSVEVEILRLSLLHFPFEEAAAKARRTAAAGALLANSEVAGEEPPREDGGECELDAFLRSCLRRIHALLASADRNLRCVGVDILARLFAEKRDMAADVAACIPEFRKFVLQAAEECDPTIRSRGIDLLTKTATAESFTQIAEQLVAAAGALEAQRLPGQTRSEKETGDPRSALAVAASPASLRASFLLPVLRMGAENHYALVEDFEWYLALLASIAVDGGESSVDSYRGRPAGAGLEEEGAEPSVSGLVAEQLVDITVRVPAVRPCAALLASLICDSAGASTAGRETLRKIHRAHQRQAGVLREVEAFPEKAEQTVAPVVVRAAAWIVGEYFEYLDGNHADENVDPREGGSLSFYFDACRSLIRLARCLVLPPPVQQVVVSAAVKVFLGACSAVSRRRGLGQPRLCSAKEDFMRLCEVQEAMLAMLERCKAAAEGEHGSSPSSSVEVYDRVRLAEQLVRFFGPGDSETAGQGEGLRVWGVRQGAFLPVLPGAQQQVPLDASLDLSSPFFDYRRLQSQQASGARAPEALPQAPSSVGAASEVGGALNRKGDTSGDASGVGWRGGGPSSNGKKRFDVIRSAIAPGQPQGSPGSTTSPEKPACAVSLCLNSSGPEASLVSSSVSAVSSVESPPNSGGGATAAWDMKVRKCLRPSETAQEAGVPLPLSLQLQLKGRLWQSCGGDELLRIFCCVGEVQGPTAPDAPPAVAVALCCEKAGSVETEVSEVGIVFSEADSLGLPALVPLASELKRRSERVVVKPASFSSLLCCASTGELRDWRLEGRIVYTTESSSVDFSSLDGDAGVGEPDRQKQQRSAPFVVEIPATVGLLPLQMTEDELASFFTQAGGAVSAQHSERVAVRTRTPSPAAGCTDTWCVSLGGGAPTSPLSVLQYLRIVACAANMFLLPQQPLPSSVCSSGVLKCLLIAQLYNPDGAHQLQTRLEKVEAGRTECFAPPSLPADLSGHQVLLAFVACSCGGESPREKDTPEKTSEEGSGILHFRVNVRSASATCSEAVCRRICTLLEETAFGRLHVFTE
ncbi:adaptin n terminal region domain-containing protein [Toxoplasma gondii ARI]|uniref:Adaptin n terminal region domain-containing protein n=1 Tax=Toxoplasma gondii ARI TaxID=1074872 RepID=A0A139Y7Z4_TOXGO|nr:adaptin n terminal region domain-containing protein [Toxoplasma gondii ARI]